MRSLLVLAAALSLSGCWTGLELFSASDARPALPPGLYRASSRGDADRIYRVSIMPNGRTRFDGGEKIEVYGFAPLGPNSDEYAAWLEIEADPSGRHVPDEVNQIYGLLVRNRDGTFSVYLPDCSEATAEIARRNGATVANSECRFRSRAALAAALRELPRDKEKALELQPVR